jgi:two-component system sensor histidine kinase VicK
LRQVFSNLLSNAEKFCFEGKIEVHIESADHEVLVSVKDQGVGIPKHNLKKIFDPYFKTNPKGIQANGSGLGLVVAKHWIEKYHGTIWAESDGDGKGTKIAFILPTGVPTK